LFSYDRTKNFQKKVGNWNLEGISLYYAFTLINGKLFGSKCFSVILEDWVPLYFKETIEEIIVAAVVPEIPPIPGIDISATGPILLNRTVKQIVLPQNGKRGSLKKGMIYILLINVFMKEIVQCGLTLEELQLPKHYKRKRIMEDEEEDGQDP
jgi:hypothetical protein